MKYDIRINEYGTKCYYVNNELHREDGPAIESLNGNKIWFRNGKCHRKDGPAVEFANGKKEWHLNNKCYGYNNDFTDESWKRFVKTLIFS